MSSTYIGNELEIFEHARNWKNYYASFIKPALGKRVGEIGAGLGGTTTALCDGSQESWLCVEPDAELVKEIDRKITNGTIPPICKSFTGYSFDLKQKFDSLLYIDVIEHIEDDKAELERAAAMLHNNGTLIIIVPAHQTLYSPFDKLIGHFRRYSRKRLRSAVPASMKIEKAYYLDSAGYFASLVNKLFLKQGMPTLKQVQFWDRVIVPVSRIADRLLGFNFGK
ncbi:MAG: class I SAM-dependent methyltransferase, partial [Chitinophagaceae bacterium]|nr:class I SAM-dependent methyltransferase [Chitinophagaceae bacterium]